MPDATVTVGDTFTATAAATDADAGDTMEYSLTTSPAGATIDGSSGAISWAPGSSDVGRHGFTVSVSDGRGGTDTTSFAVAVEAANNNAGADYTPSTIATSSAESPNYVTGLGTGTALADVIANATNNAPLLGTIPDATVTVGDTFTATASASDPDGDVLNYSLDVGPYGAKMDETAGAILWLTGENNVGPHDFVISAYDGRGGMDVVSFTVTITADDVALKKACR